ncbi:MAG: MurR/RpiR family transcriptional regulator [Pseudomonadota bacterium]
MQKNKNLLERIVNGFADLSPNARKIAGYIQQHPYSVLSMSMAELAGATNTSKATVSRFFKQLGYESHHQARHDLVSSRDKGFPVSSSIDNEKAHLNNELNNIQQTLNDIPKERLVEIGVKIAAAERIFIVGFRNSYPMAMHFRQQLMQIRKNVVLLPQPGQSLGEDLVDVDASDLIILIGFRRRPSHFEQLIKSLIHQNVVLIADPTGQIFNSDVEHLLICHVGGKDSFDSYSAPMSLIATLCNKAYQEISANAAMRAANISAWYAENNEISKL